MATPDDLVPTAEAAKMLGLSVPTLNRWAVQKRIEPAWRGPGERGVRLYRRADIEALQAEASA